MSGDLNNPNQYNDLIGDILKKHTSEGGMDNLKGAGKPLPKEYFSGDTFQHFQRIAEDAGYKPYWLNLRHEIRDEIHSIIEDMTVSTQDELNKRMAEINEKIMNYNKACPPPMQKGRVSFTSIKQVAPLW